MKYNILLLVVLLSSQLYAQQARIAGFVTEMNSGKKNVKGVLVKAAAPARASQVITMADGSFTILFQDMNPGQSVILKAEKAGWVVVNEKEMKVIIPAQYMERSFSIVMCPKHKLEQNKKIFYKITDKYIKEAYKKKLDSIDRSKQGWQNKVKALNEYLKRLEKQVKEIAEEYSITNLDDLSKIEKQAILLFKAGKIEESIQLRKTMKSDSILPLKIKIKKEQDSIIQNLKKTRQSTGKIIEKIKHHDSRNKLTEWYFLPTWPGYMVMALTTDNKTIMNGESLPCKHSGPGNHICLAHFANIIPVEQHG